ncbi:MAG: TetR/AcrR family transcriptional regulator [Acidimicrobiales bacterium]
MTDSPDDATSTQPAHRPSRRNNIIDAAIRLFAQKGYVDAAISDVAQEADVVATAIYYHFSGKEELYGACITRVFESISNVADQARRSVGDGSGPDITPVIDAVWEWIDEHPDEAALLHLQLPGATRQITKLRQDFEDKHVQRAFGYLGESTSRGRVSAARRSVESLTVRTLIDVLISVHTMHRADSPLSNESGAKLRQALHALAGRLVIDSSS